MRRTKLSSPYQQGHCTGFHGLLLLQAGPDVLRLVPALNLTDADVAEGLVRLRAALAGFVGR